MDYFFMHDEGMRDSLYVNWVAKSTWPWALPGNMLRAYFGEKVGCTFTFF